MAGSRFVSPVQQPVQSTGLPYAGGKLYFYLSGTATPTPTYSDSTLMTPNTNPVILDSSGNFGNIFLDPTLIYKASLFDANGDAIWSYDPIYPLASASVTGTFWGGTSTGSANAQVTAPSGFSFGDGQTISFIAGFTNNGPMTFNGGAGGALPVYAAGQAGPIALTGGEIAVGNIVTLAVNTALGSSGGYQIVAPNFVTAQQQQNYLAGLSISNDAGSPNTTLDIASGVAASDNNASLMQLATGLVKTTAAWVAGTNQGALDTGTIAVSTWYYVFLIQRLDTGATDILFSASMSSPTFPAAYSLKRLIACFFTNSSAHITGFVQTDDTFLWKVLGTDINNVSLPTTASLLTLGSVPPGLKVMALIYADISNTVASAFGLLNSPDANSIAGGAIGAAGAVNLYTPGIMTQIPGIAQLAIVTNTAQQIRGVSTDADTLLTITTYGYVFTRGRLS